MEAIKKILIKLYLKLIKKDKEHCYLYAKYVISKNISGNYLCIWNTIDSTYPLAKVVVNNKKMQYTNYDNTKFNFKISWYQDIFYKVFFKLKLYYEISYSNNLIVYFLPFSMKITEEKSDIFEDAYNYLKNTIYKYENLSINFNYVEE